MLNMIRGLFRRLAGLIGSGPAWVLIATVLILSLLVATRPRLQATPQPEPVWTVTTVKAQHQDLQPELTLFGEVVPGRHSELRALVSGPVLRVGPNFHNGGIVRKGELLLQIDPFNYETALAERVAELAEARAKLEKLERDRVRTETLFRDKTVSEQFMDDAELAVRTQSALVEQREIGVQRATRELSDARLVAPFDGVIDAVSANLGKQMSTNDKVADLIDTSRLEVKFSLSNAQYGRLLPAGATLVGRPVVIAWRVGDQTLAFKAVVARVGGRITATTGGVDVYATVDARAQQSALRPGAFVEVKMPDKLFQSVLKVPDTALYGDDVVYVIADGRLAERRVAILAKDGDNLLLQSRDAPAIRNGDLVVTSQLREAGPGSRVRSK